MSRASPYGVGGVYGSRGTTRSVGRLVLPLGASTTVVSRILQTEALPYLHLWAQQTAPGAGFAASVRLRGSVAASSTLTDPLGAQDAWVYLTPPIILLLGAGVINVPFAPVGFLFPVRRVQLEATSVAGALVPTSIDYILAANG